MSPYELCRDATTEALRFSELRYRRLFETAKDGILILDAETGMIVDVNPFLEELLGTRRETILGKRVWELGFLKDIAANEDKFAELREQEYVRYEDLPLESAEGRPIAVEFVSNVYLVNGQRVSQCNIRDITARKQAEEALRESEERFRAVFRQSPVGIVVGDLDGRILESNTAFQQMLGYTAEELHGRSLASLTHPDDLQIEMQCVRDVLAGARTQYEIEQRYLRKDRETIWVHLTGSRLCVVRGKPSGALVMVEDISGRKRTEESSRRIAEELVRSNRDLEQFAYVASHDLQEPLRGISGFLKLLEEQYKPQLDDKAKEYIRYSVDSAARMSQLVTDLLAYSRVGIKCKVPETVDSNRALAVALANLRGSIQEAGATVTHDELPSVCGDVSQLTQLFQNLIGNAVKFRYPDRPCHVHISARQQEGKWLFSVRDNGIGIASEHYERVFVIFQRLHGRGEYSGTGIGLAICKKIVEQHGGRIWVESKVGEGSTFYCTLALARQGIA